eukprot:Blabericola_migrator_1__2465@NODE_1695_length_3984_cov_38_238958_g1098_i0_p4_GENE_NODE_1695_length_3984_cov_38_238958_g1098_i0NODE_1695_length_3984_cov_38_238958_g1098_i0_p4_ORF_typecomplete_len102_score6_87FAD_binding_8/PF08022_12/0_09_NODE_1695_length_3984_cov_38_238958_g1098_i023372642
MVVAGAPLVSAAASGFSDLIGILSRNAKGKLDIRLSVGLVGPEKAPSLAPFCSEHPFMLTASSHPPRLFFDADCHKLTIFRRSRHTWSREAPKLVGTKALL